jgi:maltooligosyltrehalose trehalohydrolase
VRRRLPIGAEVIEGGVDFRVWAPACRSVTVVLEGAPLPMRAEERGYFGLFVPRLGAGTRYRFQLDDSSDLAADPVSRSQPEGPFGPSQVVDPSAFAWTDHAWPGIPELHRQILYELHVGTFTPAGTWRGAGERLAFLADVGITTIEMMPVNEFAGARGWGYDGVNLFAPEHAYGTPDDLRAFVDRAHATGIAVILDVVYNHLGPAGNSLFRFGPYKHEQLEPTEWGESLEFSERGVREFFTANAGYWIDEFHFDGLRLDATQAIHDQSSPHILEEVVRRARAAAGTRKIFVVAENEPQDTALITDLGIDALWNDDFEHTARVALTGANDGYLHDYGGTPQELVSAIKHGFLYQGQAYAWQRNVRGTPTRDIPRWRFVNFLENHDQIANVAFGERLSSLSDPAHLRALTAVLLLGPELPMLFQGQEGGTSRPWHYFVDHEPELAKLVREGRAHFLTQFARLATPEAQAMMHEPSARETFDACVLADPPDPRMVALHRDLIALRAQGFAEQTPDGAVLSSDAFCLRWWEPDFLLLVNLGPTLREAILPEPLLAPPLRTGWKIAWSSEHPTYGGHGTPDPFTVKRLAIPAHAAVLCTPDTSAWLRVDPAPASGQNAPVDP